MVNTAPSTIHLDSEFDNYKQLYSIANAMDKSSTIIYPRDSERQVRSIIFSTFRRRGGYSVETPQNLLVSCKRKLFQ